MILTSSHSVRKRLSLLALASTSRLTAYGLKAFGIERASAITLCSLSCTYYGSTIGFSSVFTLICALCFGKIPSREEQRFFSGSKFRCSRGHLSRRSRTWYPCGARQIAKFPLPVPTFSIAASADNPSSFNARAPSPETTSSLGTRILPIALVSILDSSQSGLRIIGSR